MPSTTPKMRRTMAAAAHNPRFARRMGIPQDVAEEFNEADQAAGTLGPAMKKQIAQAHALKRRK